MFYFDTVELAAPTPVSQLGNAVNHSSCSELFDIQFWTWAEVRPSLAKTETLWISAIFAQLGVLLARRACVSCEMVRLGTCSRPVELRYCQDDPRCQR